MTVNSRPLRFRRSNRAVLASLLLAAPGVPFAEVIEQGGDPGPTPPAPRAALCIEKIRNVHFSSSAPQLTVGAPTTLAWGLSLPPECDGSVWLTITGVQGGLPRSGTMVVRPKDSRVYELVASKQGSSATLATASVAVEPTRDAQGHIDVTIDSPEQVGLFLRAIGSEGTYSHNATVRLANHVVLDLTGRDTIQIKPGVRILGGRTATEPGPLIFTDSFPRWLFAVGDDLEPGNVRIAADNVHVSGVRIRGPRRSVVSHYPASSGIRISSSINVQVDNSELQGWTTSAIDVRDPHGRINVTNGRGAVRLIGNALHHNQGDQEGYGVEVGEGAYVLIDRNHFDHNRHAIAGGGEPGTGYFAYRNHIGNTGGHHGAGNRTHQVDMHGEGTFAGLEGYSGGGGEYMDVRSNAIMYDAGNAVAIRGAPSIGSFFERNAFKHSDPHGGIGGNFDAGAFYQFASGYITQRDNRLGSRIEFRDRVCDLDGDGAPDSFASNGATWLYRPGAVGEGAEFYDWRYLNTSPLRAVELDFGHEDADGRCDVLPRGTGGVSLGGRTPVSASGARVLVRMANGATRLRTISDGVLIADNVLPIGSDWDILGARDIDDDGDDDVLAKKRTASIGPDGETTDHELAAFFIQNGAYVSQRVLNDRAAVGSQLLAQKDFDGDGVQDTVWQSADRRVSVRMPGRGGRMFEADLKWQNQDGWRLPSDWSLVAAGDFNGDLRSDIAWRHQSGQVCVWLMAGGVYTAEYCPGGTNADGAWKVQGVGDFDGDGRDDILWRYSDGALAIWFDGAADRVAYPTWHNQRGGNAGNDWSVIGIADADGDGKSDILWRHTSGEIAEWHMDGGRFVDEAPVLQFGADWHVQAVLR